MKQIFGTALVTPPQSSPSGGSMNQGPELLGPPSSGAAEIFLGKTLRKIIKIVATR